MNKSNKQAETKSRYLVAEKTKHIMIFIFPKTGTDANYLKTLLSDYHNEMYSTEVFEIDAILLGLNQHLLSVKTFNDKVSGMRYYENIFSASKIMQELSKTEHKLFVISKENFQEFYKTKDIKEYTSFFKKNYLDTQD